MDPTILTPAMGKLEGKLSALTLVWQLVWKKENSKLKSTKLRLKFGLVSHPARGGGVG